MTLPTPPTLKSQRWLLTPLDHGLLLLIALRLVITVLMIFLNLPPLQSHIGFYFHHGGDQDYYFEYGQVLLSGQFDKWFAVNLGQPAIMAFGVLLFGGRTFTDLLTYLVIVNAWIFGLLGVWLVGRLAYLFTDNIPASWLAAGLWAIMPWIVWVAVLPHPEHVWLQAPYAPASAWLNGLPDGPATFFALLCLYFLLRARQPDTNPAIFALLSGLSLGVSLLFKAHLLSILPLVAGFLFIDWLFHRRDPTGPRALLIGLWVWRGVVLGYLPQVLYNWLARTWDAMIPWLPGYLYFGVLNSKTNEINADLSPVSLAALADNLLAVLNRGGGLLWVAAAIGAVAGLAALWWVARLRGWPLALLLFGAIPGTIGVNLVSAYFMDDPIRFSLPGFPMTLVLGCYVAVTVLSALRDWRQHRLQQPSPTPSP